MDFSFVGGDAGLQRKQQQPAAGSGQAGGGGGNTHSASQAAGSTPSRIAIPSFRDVQQAERKRVAVPNMFKPSGFSGGSGGRCEGACHVVVPPLVLHSECSTHPADA